MYSHLPGTPVDAVPVGARVTVIFEATANGQKVPEWQVVGEPLWPFQDRKRAEKGAYNDPPASSRFPVSHH